MRFRRSMVTVTSGKNRPEVQTIRIRWKLLQKNLPGLYTKMGECQILNLVSKALDLDPWGVCAPPRALDASQRIPPMESTAIWLKMIVSPNNEMGQKDLSGSALKICMQHQMSVRKSCTLNG
jgi:hypothetical protein